MPAYTQAGRLMAVTTPLGADVLLLEKFDGTEPISGLFRFDLELLAEAGAAIAFDAVLGQPATVALPLPSGAGTRFVNGIVSRFAEGGVVPGPKGKATFTRYYAELVPKVWLLTRRGGPRIFQQISVIDILKKVFAGFDVKYQAQGTFEPRDYCVQYRETDWAFASRLMEEEGIYHFFTHADGSHSMVLANTPQGHPDVPAAATIEYAPAEGGFRNHDYIDTWVKTQEVRTGKVTLWDHSFELPGKNLQAVEPTQASVAVGTVTHSLQVPSGPPAERYDFPGAYAQRFDGTAPGGGDRAADVQKIFQDNTRTAKIRMQQEAARAVEVRGTGNCRQLTPGHAFALTGHPNADGRYVVTGVTHAASQVGAYNTDADGGTYRNAFTGVPVALPYRPPQVTPKPVIHGTQSAVVVGPAGEEIFTDKYGRVKVQFAWHREGKLDADSSCWVRVATSWAGTQWGAIVLPRIGHEVVVAFEEGDPDRPIVVGSVYNADNMPPYTLPDHRTKWGFKSRSSLKGTGENFNELRFEEKKDSEEIYFHAEKDFNRVVENNDTLKVGFEKKTDGNQLVEIFNNQTLFVGAGKGQAADGSQTETIWKDRTVTLETGNDTLHIKKGNRGVDIDLGNDKLTIKAGNQTIKLDAGWTTTEAMQYIQMKVGANFIRIDQTGITMQGIMIRSIGQTQVLTKAPTTLVMGNALLLLKGGKLVMG